MAPDQHGHRGEPSRCPGAAGAGRPAAPAAVDLMAVDLPGDVPWAVLERDRQAALLGPDDGDHVPEWVRRLWSAEDEGSDGESSPGARPAGPAALAPAAAAADLDAAAADALAGLAPGAGLVRLMDRLDPETASDAEVVEAVAAAARMEAWAHAAAARWAAVLARRPSMNPVWSRLAGRVPAQSSVAGDELAMRLAVPRRTAVGLVEQGRAFAGALQATGAALAAGRIDPDRARVLVGRLGPLPAQVATAVEDRVLPEAEYRTVSQVRRDVERALVEVDAAEADARHVRARRGRRVDHPRLLPDGMAGLWCVLPAADSARVDGVLDAAARTARTCGDPRTLDQLRADGLRDLVLGGTVPSAVPDGVVPSDTSPSSAPSSSASPSSNPSNGAAPNDARPDSAPPAGPVPNPAVQVRVTVPLSTLLGVDDRPGEIAGLGPVDAVQARALAAGGVWRRIVTDPLTGTVLDVGRTRYRPPVGLAEHVRARDGRCSRPGCEVDAARADLDHTVEFHGRPAERHGPPTDEGTTSADNLGPLCRRDHRLKTDGGFVLRQPQPGVFEWTTRAGLQYRVRPGADRGYRRLAPLGDPATVDRAGLDPVVLDPVAVDRAAVDRAGLDPAGVDRAGLDPAGVDRAGLDPAGVDPARVDLAAGGDSADGSPPY